MSLQAYALTTFVGMVSPAFALTYLGSAVVTAQWPFILAGGLLVVVFFFLAEVDYERSEVLVGVRDSRGTHHGRCACRCSHECRAMWVVWKTSGVI